MRTRHVIGLAALVSVPLLAGCAAQQASFRPAQTTGYEMGYPATLYDVSVEGQHIGIVRVYSQGAYPAPGTGQPVVEVEMRIRNLSDGPMNLDLAKCDVDAATAGGEQVLTNPMTMAPLEPIPAGGIGRIALSYPLEGNVAPGDVSNFDFDWTLNTPKGLYANTTSFIRRMYNNTYYYYPAYGGWWGYPWGWGGYYGPYWGPYYGGFYGGFYGGGNHEGHGGERGYRGGEEHGGERGGERGGGGYHGGGGRGGGRR
jgi:hypothetical protein